MGDSFVGTPSASATPAAAGETTLFDILLSISEAALKGVQYGTATGGSVTTLTDENTSNQGGYFKNGTLFFLDGSNARTFVKITDYNGSTFTFGTLSLAIVSGVHYVAAPPHIRMDEMIQAVNEALKDLGATLQEDVTLVTVADQEEYTLPDGVSGLRQVEIATSTTTPYLYNPSYWWKEHAGKLRFLKSTRTPTQAGFKIRLTYKMPHAAIFAATDNINAVIGASWLKWAAIINLLRGYGNRGNWADLKLNWEEAQGQYQMMRKPVPDIPIIRLAG